MTLYSEDFTFTEKKNYLACEGCKLNKMSEKKSIYISFQKSRLFLSFAIFINNIIEKFEKLFEVIYTW